MVDAPGEKQNASVKNKGNNKSDLLLGKKPWTGLFLFVMVRIISLNHLKTMFFLMMRC